MNVLALEGLVEDGQIRLLDGAVLPDKTKVYVVVPGVTQRTPRVWSPRLANPQDASQFFRMEVTELPRPALMPSYDADRFDPPAPVARVALRSFDQSLTVTDVPMLLDAGADVTLIPRAAAKNLALPDRPAGSFQLVGFDGKASTAPAFDLEMIFSGRVFRGRFLLIEEPLGILGRNVLNAVPVLFDGPRLTWELRTKT